jgi:lysophospholipase L1-like esterase
MKSVRMSVLVAIVCALGALLGTDTSAQPTAGAVGTDLTRVLAEALTLIGEQPAPAQLLIKPGDRVAFMGDSITQQGGYVRLAQFVLNANYPDLKPTFLNAGISGQKAENMAPRFDKDMHLAEKPAWCFISVGINDVWHRLGAPPDPAVLEAYRANVTKMVEAAQAAGAQAVLLTPTVIQEDPNAEGNQRLQMYVDAEKQIAADKQCALVDLHAMFLAALAAKPPALRLTADGVHMSPYGDAIMACGVLRALGVPDATIAATDIMPALMVRPFGMTLTQAAALLEVPSSRFFKPELARFLGF